MMSTLVPPLALQISKQAVEDSQSKSAHILDTYARALFDSGKKEEAVKAQEKALSVASDEEKEALEKTIKAYQGRKTSFGIMVHSTRRASPSLRKRVGFRCQTTASRLPLARRSSGRAPQPTS
jgi:hypothetical protein